MTVHKEIETDSAVVTVRMAVEGKLHVRGAESGIGNGKVQVTSSSEPSISHEGDVVEVHCYDDCVVDVPSHAQLEIDTKGDLTVENVAGNVGIIRAKGNASLSSVGDVQAEKIFGDLRVAQAAGIKAEKVDGNAHINDARGVVEVNAKGDVHLHGAGDSVSANAKGDIRLSEVIGEYLRANAKGDIHLDHCKANITANGAGDVRIHEVVSQQVKAVAKGDIHLHFATATGGAAKVVTSGELRVQNGETILHRGKGVYTFRFGEGTAELSLISKGDIHLLGLSVAENDLRGISADMGAWGEEFGAEMGEEMGTLGAELGAWGAEFSKGFGREFGTIGRDIARQVQDKVERKVRAKMKGLGKRTAKVEWGEGKSWSFNFGDTPTPPSSPKAPAAPDWDTPFDPVEEPDTGEPVSEEERALVLRMLEEGKISAAEAATLLEALGDAE